MSVPQNPLYVIGKSVNNVFTVSAATATLTPTNTASRIYRLRLCDLHISQWSDRPNRLVEATVPPATFASLWRASLPNQFTADPADGYFSFVREKRKIKCYETSSCSSYSSSSGAGGKGRGGGGCGCGSDSCCNPCEDPCAPCDPCAKPPCIFSALVGGAQVNADRTLDLQFQLCQDIKEFAVETRLSGVAITLNRVFIPPIGSYRLDITPTKACPVFNDAFVGCNPNSNSKVSTTYSILFSDGGNTMDFSDPVDTTGSINRFSLRVSWPRVGVVQLTTRAGVSVMADAQERYDEAGTNKYRKVWVWTFDDSTTPPDFLPDYAFSSRWILTSSSTEPSANC
jgi:hypothetical protein